MPIPSQFEVGRLRFHGSWCIPVTLSSITGNGDVVTEFTPGFAGAIKKWYWIQGVPVTTTSKAATLNLEINAVDVQSVPGTNSTIALTSAACTPLGKVIDGSSIGLKNTFDKDDTISVEASSVTAFAEGSGVIVIEYEGKVL